MIKDYPCRKLSKLISQERPEHLLFIDTETKQRSAKIAYDGKILLSGWDELYYGDRVSPVELHTFKMGWSCYSNYELRKGLFGEDWRYWSDCKQLCIYIATLTKPAQPLYLFAHNIFFDLQVSDFFYWFTKWKWILDFIYDRGNVYILVIHKDLQVIKCISTTNYFDGKLAVAGKMLGVPKLRVDFKKVSSAVLSKYCKRDTLIVRELVNHYLKFIDKHSLGKFGLTKSSQAFNCFRSSFMDKVIYIHRDEKIQSLEERAYIGARTECGWLGEVSAKSFVSLDVNGLYPTVMFDNFFPVKLIGYYDNPDEDKLDLVLKRFAAVAKVWLDTPEPAYAVKQGIKVIFPIGKFETYLCTEGLRYAFKNKHLVCVEQLAVYDKGRIFTDYISFFNRLKEKYSRENNVIMRKFTKDMMNCLYGKFAQKSQKITEEEQIDCKGYYREETYDSILKRTETVTKLFNKLVVTYGSELCNTSFVAIAAHVTEYARFYLWNLMKQVGIDNVLYCDTDSLKIEAKHLPKLRNKIHPYKLGYLKVEKRFKYFFIGGAKHYYTDKETKIKGVPKSAEKIGNYKYKYTTFLKQKSHLNSQVTRYYITKPTIKVVEPYYNKGVVLANGRIVPFRLNSF